MRPTGLVRALAGLPRAAKRQIVGTRKPIIRGIPVDHPRPGAGAMTVSQAIGARLTPGDPMPRLVLLDRAGSRFDFQHQSIAGDTLVLWLTAEPVTPDRLAAFEAIVDELTTVAARPFVIAMEPRQAASAWKPRFLSSSTPNGGSGPPWVCPARVSSSSTRAAGFRSSCRAMPFRPHSPTAVPFTARVYPLCGAPAHPC